MWPLVPCYGRSYAVCEVSGVPGANNLRLFSWNLDLRLLEKTTNVSDRPDSGGDEPRQTKDRADHYQQRQHEHIQVIAVRLLYGTTCISLNT